MEGRDQAHRAVPIGGRCRVESQRPVQPLANGRAVVRALPEEDDDAWAIATVAATVRQAMPTGIAIETRVKSGRA